MYVKAALLGPFCPSRCTIVHSVGCHFGCHLLLSRLVGAHLFSRYSKLARGLQVSGRMLSNRNLASLGAKEECLCQPLVHAYEPLLLRLPHACQVAHR